MSDWGNPTRYKSQMAALMTVGYAALEGDEAFLQLQRQCEREASLALPRASDWSRRYAMEQSISSHLGHVLSGGQLPKFPANNPLHAEHERTVSKLIMANERADKAENAFGNEVAKTRYLRNKIDRIIKSREAMRAELHANQIELNKVKQTLAASQARQGQPQQPTVPIVPPRNPGQ